jgi:hypothetical protein
MDLSKISHLEARQAVKAHFDADDEFSAAENAATAAVRAKMDAARKLIREKELELEREHFAPLRAELEAIEKPFREREEQRFQALEKKLEELGVEPSEFKLYDDWSGTERCAVSGLPLMEDDITGETPDGDPFLFDLVLQQPEDADA